MKVSKGAVACFIEMLGDAELWRFDFALVNKHWRRAYSRNP
jgi:hypothetical protein